MRVTTILVAIAASLAIATPAPSPDHAAATEPRANEDERDFDCDSTWLQPFWNHRLMAKCPRSTGPGKYTIEWADLNLNDCLVNYFGMLRWQENGLAMSSCRDCRLTDEHTTQPVLYCKCDRPHKSARETSISLRDGIWNNNGTLECRPDPSQPTPEGIERPVFPFGLIED